PARIISLLHLPSSTIHGAFLSTSFISSTMQYIHYSRLHDHAGAQLGHAGRAHFAFPTTGAGIDIQGCSILPRMLRGPIDGASPLRHNPQLRHDLLGRGLTIRAVL